MEDENKKQRPIGSHSNINLAANNPGLPAPNHSKFHLPSKNGDLSSSITSRILKKKWQKQHISKWKCFVKHLRSWSRSWTEPLKTIYPFIHINPLHICCLSSDQSFKTARIFELNHWTCKKKKKKTFNKHQEFPEQYYLLH